MSFPNALLPAMIWAKVRMRAGLARIAATLAIAAIAGCTTTTPVSNDTRLASYETPKQSDTRKFEEDRQAILAMAGNFNVTFDFIETVSFVDDYELKDRKISGGNEIVRVIEDTGNYISLQHILVVGGEQKFPVKHWRQDWHYEPESVLVFIGGNAWEKRPLSRAQSKGKWSQIVYQVDDAPRYGAIANWTHENGVSQWTPPHEWRPLPRRDATTRDDYHVVDAQNRHAITPNGWVHEQDNSKVMLYGDAQTLVREIAINTYERSDSFSIDVGEDYWAKTKGFWAGIREEWSRIETANERYGLTIQGEPEALYLEILGLAEGVANGDETEAAAIAAAVAVIQSYVTTEISTLGLRIAE